MPAKFSLGQTVATPSVLALLTECDQSPTEFISRHISGNWGNLGPDDKQANDDGLIHGNRLLSSYKTNNGQKIWVITEAADDKGNRLSTTLLLPSEY